ncbi:MAG: hypothetical protein V1494_06875 [Candidatus Diapherotrites archaeon]
MAKNLARFSCVKCGRCCNEDILKTEQEDDEKIKKFQYGPVYMPPAIKPGTILTDFERETVKKGLNENSIKAELIPEVYLFDLKSKTRIVQLWKLLGQPCPALSNNKCGIYKYRPLLCKAWPLTPCEPDFKKSRWCTALKGLDEEYFSDKKFSALFFWDQLIPINQYMNSSKVLVGFLGRLKESKLIECAQGISESELINKYGEFTSKGILEFMSDNGVDSERLTVEMRKRVSKKIIEDSLRKNLGSRQN